MPTTPATVATWRSLLNARMLAVLFLGFSSGLPLFTMLYLMQAWLAKSGVDIKALGLFALVGFPVHLQVPVGAVHGPLQHRPAGTPARLDGADPARAVPGDRLDGHARPATQLPLIVLAAGVMTFLSASQDIVIDAYRREILADHEQGLGAAVVVNAYKAAGLVPSALGLILADSLPWSTVFWVVGAFMLPGLVCTLLAPEPQVYGAPPKNMHEAIVLPFREFIARDGWRQAMVIVAFVLLYKIGDSMATALATKFYLDIGFTTTQIGLAANATGLWASLAGGVVGGIWMVKLGINRALWVFGALQAVAILGFAWLAHVGPNQFAAGRRDRLRVVRQPRSRRRRAGGVHFALDRPALHRHPVRTVLQPGRGAAHVHQFVGRLYRRGNRLVHVLYRVLRAGVSCDDDAAENRTMEQTMRKLKTPCRAAGAVRRHRLRAGRRAAAASRAGRHCRSSRCRSGATSQPQAKLDQQAAQQYAGLMAQAQQKGALVPDNHPQVMRLRAIAKRIIPYATRWNPDAAKWKWQVNLLNSKQVNAFCMPGGRIAFFTGILTSLKLTDDEVAAVMGHEIAHALREHGRERAAKAHRDRRRQPPRRRRRCRPGSASIRASPIPLASRPASWWC